MVKGLSAIKDSIESSAAYIKLKDGEAIVVKIAGSLDDIIGVYEHVEQLAGNWKTLTCLSKAKDDGLCPLCNSGKKPSFKTYIPVVDIADNKVKIFKASRDFITLLVANIAEYGDLTKRTIKIVRAGTGINTKYNQFVKDDVAIDMTDLEIPNIEAMCAPVTKEAMTALMQGGSADTSTDGFTPVASGNDFPF